MGDAVDCSQNDDDVDWLSAPEMLLIVLMSNDTDGW